MLLVRMNFGFFCVTWMKIGILGFFCDFLLLVCILESLYNLMKLCRGEVLPRGKEKVEKKMV